MYLHAITKEMTIQLSSRPASSRPGWSVLMPTQHRAAQLAEFRVVSLPFISPQCRSNLHTAFCGFDGHTSLAKLQDSGV